MKEELKALKIERHKKSRPRNGVWFWRLLSLALALILLGLSYQVYLSPEGPKVEAEQPDVVPTEVPKTEPVKGPREVLIASGYVVAHHKHELGSKVMGRVEWIGVEKGDLVQKGQLLVKLEDREFRAQLGQAEAALQQAEERLRELEAGSRPEEVERAEAEMKRASADLANAKLELGRLEKLLASGVVAQTEVDSARVRMKMAEESLKAVEKQHALLVLGPREEQVSQARADVDRARAMVEYQKTMLEATEIRAPISGTVLRRIAEVGEMITTSFAGTGGAKSSVVALADLNDLQVELDISQTDFNKISSGHKCEMSPEAFPDRVYDCVIDEISPEANRQKASIEVKVKVLEPDEFLRPEMSARVTFSEKGDGNHE